MMEDWEEKMEINWISDWKLHPSGGGLETLEYFWIHILLDTLGIYYHDIFLGRNRNLFGMRIGNHFMKLEKGPYRRKTKLIFAKSTSTKK